MVLGKRLEDHLRFAVAYWHSFVWPGGDPFGGQTFERPWFGETMDKAKLKADVAFEMFSLLGAPFYCFHDADVRPEGANFAENTRNLDEITDYFAEKQAATGVKLLWGTANLFSHRRYMGGRGDQSGPGRLHVRRGDGEDLHRRDDEARRRELRAVGRARRLRDAAQHRHGPRARPARPVPQHGRRVQAQDRLQGHDPDRAEAAGADQAPVRLRRRHRLRLPQALRAGERGQGQYRAGPRDPRRPLLRARAAPRRRARHLRLDRHEPQRLPVRLGHRPVPQQRAGDGARLLPDPAGTAASPPAARISTPSCAASRSSRTTC